MPMKPKYDYTKKPYYRCLSCPRFRNECGGIPTRGLDLKEWSEYIRDVMDHFDLTSAEVAKDADISQRKVESIHAINVEQDIMRATARRIEQVVLGPATNHACDMDFDATAAEKITALEKKLADMKEDRDLLAQIIKQFINKDK